ncbi:hypothetical protein BDV93DRAFT_514953 [Ceratobasidium sp. AG-I]|nr:hypothetical protein BDV93DRAFT_514953 [Ceratobasidium sp. AG-I]
MPDRTYTRLTKTVSRTQAQQQADNKLKKQIAKGIASAVDEIPHQSKTYNYSGHHPQPVDPNISSASSGLVVAATAIPIPYLADQQDIPVSDSPAPEERIQVPPPLAVNLSQKNSHAAPVHCDNDDNQSQADTVIDSSQSSTSDSECDANEGLEIESGDVCDNGIEATLQKVTAVSPHLFAITPLALPASAGISPGLYCLPVLPLSEPISGQHNPQPEHAFGPPPIIPEIDLTNLSTEEQSILWNAPFPIVNHTGLDPLAGMEFQAGDEAAELYLGAGSPMGIPPGNSTFAMADFNDPSTNFNSYQDAQFNGDPSSTSTAMPANPLGESSIDSQVVYLGSQPAHIAPSRGIPPPSSQLRIDTPRGSVAHTLQVQRTPAQHNQLAATTCTSSPFNPPSRAQSPLATPSRTRSPFGIASCAHSPFSPISRAASPFGPALGRTSATQVRRTSVPRVQQLAMPSCIQPWLADHRVALHQQHSRATTPIAAQAPTPATPIVSRSRAGLASALRATITRSSSIGPSPNYRLPSTPTAFGWPSCPQTASPRPPTQDRQARSGTPQLLPQMRASPCPGPRPDPPPLSSAPIAETRSDDPIVLTDSVPQDTGKEISSDLFGLEDNANYVAQIALPHGIHTVSTVVFRVHLREKKNSEWENGTQDMAVLLPGINSYKYEKGFGGLPDVSDQETADSDGLIIDESEPPIATQSTHANTVGGLTTSAPTVMEFRSKRLNEIKEIGGGRKSKLSDKGDLVKGAKRIGDFDREVQGIMSVMKASMLHTYVARAGFCEDDAVSLQRAKDFPKEHMSGDVDTIVDDEFLKAMRPKLSQIRSTGTPQILERVQSFFCLERGDEQTIKWLHERDRFLYPGNNMECGDMFNTEIIGIVLDILYFGTGSRRIGVLFIDDMLKQDDPDEMERLFTIAALLGSDGEPEIPKIMDGSQYALRGLSIASIAFAAVHVHHALERLKLPEVERSLRRKKKQGGVLKKDFNDLNYNKLWMHYVRELAAHRNLGQLRLGFSDRIKKGYCRVWRRMSHPIGNNHMW